MAYTLLIGNNFISNNPKKIQFYDNLLFTLKQKSDNKTPLISTIIKDNKNNKLVEFDENKCIYCDMRLTKKRSDEDHHLIIDESGEIIFEFRILDENTILVSGIFHIDKEQKITITQNYIVLPSGKWIMHDRIDANNKDIIITDDGIKVAS